MSQRSEHMGHMEMPASKLSSFLYWACGFCAPILFLVLLCAFSGVYPFGPESFLTEDAKYQYIDFFTWYKHVLSGDASLMYSSAQSLGMNTWSLYSFYLASPLNLLIVFFDYDHLVLFIFIVCALKLGLIQISFMFYLRKRFSNVGNMALPLAFCMTFCVWVVVNIRNPMWLDMLYWLPLAMVGAYGLIKEGKWPLLLVAFTGAIISCWYTAYMLIIFTILYALFECYIEHVDNPLFRMHDFLRAMVKGAGTVFLALALSAFTFLPTVLALLGDTSNIVAPVSEAPALSLEADTAQPAQDDGASTIIENPQGTPQAQPNAAPLPTTNSAPLPEKIVRLIIGFFTGDANFDGKVSIPELFGGTFLLAGALMFLISRHAKRRIKIAFCIFAAFMIASVSFMPLYMFWCGMRYPSGFYCRIAELFVVVLLWACAYAVNNARSCQVRRTSALIAALLACVPICALYVFGAVPQLLCVIFAIAAALTAFIVFVLVSQQSISEEQNVLVCVLSSCVIAAELLINATCAWGYLYTEYPQADHEAYVVQSSSDQKALRAHDDGLYRQAKTYTRFTGASLNEAMAIGYKDIASYTSAHNGDAVRFLNALGYSRQSEISVMYRAPMISADSILGVKYVFAKTPPSAYIAVSKDAVFRENLDEEIYANTAIYENPYALPLIYPVNEKMGSLAFDTPSNPFERQNALASALLGEDVTLYTPCEAKLVSIDPCQEWVVSVPQDAVGYYFIQDNNITLLTREPKCYVQVDDGAILDDSYRFGNAIMSLAEVAGKEPEQVDGRMVYTVRLSANAEMSAPPLEETWCTFYALDLSALDTLVEKLRGNAPDIVSFDDGSIEFNADVSTSRELMMVSVPYDDGWAVEINGKPAKLEPLADGALSGIWLDQGENHVTMHYTSPGSVYGIAISIGALIIAIVLFVLYRGKRRPSA